MSIGVDGTRAAVDRFLSKRKLLDVPVEGPRSAGSSWSDGFRDRNFEKIRSRCADNTSTGFEWCWCLSRPLPGDGTGEDRLHLGRRRLPGQLGRTEAGPLFDKVFS